MATTNRDYVEHQEFQEFRTQVNARFDGIDVQLSDLRTQVARMAEQLASMAEQLARIAELMAENTNIQKRQLGLLEAAQRSQDQ